MTYQFREIIQINTELWCTPASGVRFHIFYCISDAIHRLRRRDGRRGYRW